MGYVSSEGGIYVFRKGYLILMVIIACTFLVDDHVLLLEILDLELRMICNFTIVYEVMVSSQTLDQNNTFHKWKRSRDGCIAIYQIAWC